VKLVVFENLQFKGSELFDDTTDDQLPERGSFYATFFRQKRILPVCHYEVMSAI